MLLLLLSLCRCLYIYIGICNAYTIVYADIMKITFILIGKREVEKMATMQPPVMDTDIHTHTLNQKNENWLYFKAHLMLCEMRVHDNTVGVRFKTLWLPHHISTVAWQAKPERQKEHSQGQQSIYFVCISRPFLRFQ